MASTKKQLSHLETAGLIRLAQSHPELEFMFRHALVQEAAYNSLLIEDRKKLHRQVGEAIEQIYPNRLEEFAATLGNHFEIAGDDQRAQKYFILAGKVSSSIYANTEAVSHYTRALKIAHAREVNSEELIHLYICLGRVLELNSQFDEAQANYKEMETLAQELDDRPMALAALAAQITLYATPTPLHNPVQGLTLGKDALILARDLDDGEVEAKMLWNLSLAASWSGHVDEAISYGEEAVALARKLGLRELQAHALNDLCLIFVNSRFERAKPALEEIMRLWRELGNLPMLADSLSLACGAYTLAGKYDQVVAFSDEAFRISQSTNNLWGQSYSRMTIGRVYQGWGQPDRAITMAEECLHMSQLSGFVVPQVTVRADLGAIYGGLGAIERGLENARMALTAAEAEFPVFKMYALGILAQLYLLAGNLAEAETVVDQGKKDPNKESLYTWFVPVIIAEAELTLKQGDYDQTLEVTDVWLTTLRRTGLRSYIPSLLYTQAQALLALGQDEAARERLLEAHTEADAMGARWSLWQIFLALSKVETDPSEADNLRQQARQIVEYITDHINQDDLRQSFLNLPDVQEVLD